VAYIVFERVIRPDLPGLLTLLAFDATITETHSRKAAVTEHPVEEGSPVSDHVLPSAQEISMSAVVSNTPIYVDQDYSATAPLQAGGVVGTLPLTGLASRWIKNVEVKGGFVQPYKPPGFPRYAAPITVTPAVRDTEQYAASAKVLQFPAPSNRVRDAWRILDELMLEGTVCTVHSELNIYPAMVLVSMSAPREAKDSVEFELEFKAVRYAFVGEAEEARIKPVRREKPESHDPKTPQGQAPTITSQQLIDLLGLGRPGAASLGNNLLEILAGQSLPRGP